MANDPVFSCFISDNAQQLSSSACREARNSQAALFHSSQPVLQLKVTIIGSGYVGLVTGACLAEMGNHVVCLDVDARKIEVLNSGGIPIHEPGLQEIVSRNAAAGRLQFTTDIEAAVAHGTLQFIAVGTPPDEDGSADLQYVLAAARNIGRTMTDYKVIIDKSTVPVGTADRVKAAVQEELDKRGVTLDFAVASNPEFLKEGAAVADFTRPDRVVVGADDERAILLLRALYSPFVRNRDRMLIMDIRSAEFTKYAANAMLATRISFMNELSRVAERLGADIELVRIGIGSDPRIGTHFLYAGAGYGGSCFPKDVKALIRIAEGAGEPSLMLDAVEAVNEAQKQVLVNKVVARYGEDLSEKTFAIWGLAFKPNTDDMREAPSRVVIQALLARGAKVRAYDPVATEEAKRVLCDESGALPAGLVFATSASDAMSGADALVIVTEWKEFRTPDFDAMRESLKDKLVFDGRNLYESPLIRSFGLEYVAIGRP
jgi:UDPglucose 6-dehydrogenase